MKLKGKIKELTALTSAICMLSVPEYNGSGCYWNKNKLCPSFY